MSLNKLLSSCGICFSLYPCINRDSNYFQVKYNLARYSHFLTALKLLQYDMSQAMNEENVQQVLIQGITALPNVVAAKHLEKLHNILYIYICSKYKPTLKMSVTCPIGRSLLSICSKLYQKFSACGIRVCAPNIEEFPGDLQDKSNYTADSDAEQKGIVATVKIKSKYDEFHCTGYYLIAGCSMRLTVLEGNPKGWDIRIGCHTDDISESESLRRWPIVHSKMPLQRYMQLSTAFGGIIYLDSPKGNSTIKVRLENVITTPHYDLNNTETVTNWEEKGRKEAGLWAELSGKYITFTVPSDKIRNVKDPGPALRLWDLIVIANHELRGTDARTTWRERVVIDVQPLDGIHSGYPITIPYGKIKSNLITY
jgi:hypothetical protein